MTPPTPIQDDLRRITLLVNRYLPARLDRESVVHDIWLESWQRGVRATPRFIHWRCVDRARLESRQRRVLDEVARLDRTTLPLDPETRLDVLMAGADLTLEESKALWEVYYNRKTFPQAGQSMSLTSHEVSSLIESALTKLRSLAKESVE